MGRLFKRHTKAQKAELCEEWRASVLNQSEFCRQKDLKIATFSTWLKKLNINKKSKKIKNALKKETSFIPLSLSASQASRTEAINEPEGKRLKITLHDKLTVNLPIDIDDLLVLTILKELAQCI